MIKRTDHSDQTVRIGGSTPAVRATTFRTWAFLVVITGSALLVVQCVDSGQKSASGNKQGGSHVDNERYVCCSETTVGLQPAGRKGRDLRSLQTAGGVDSIIYITHR